VLKAGYIGRALANLVEVEIWHGVGDGGEKDQCDHRRPLGRPELAPATRHVGPTRSRRTEPLLTARAASLSRSRAFARFAAWFPQARRVSERAKALLLVEIEPLPLAP